MSRNPASQQRRLDDLLRLPENRECFECSAKQPRWASTNLGVFFCIRCAGLHRAMGTHVSKVRSTNMDTWDEEMIRCCERIGNAKGRFLYEHNMLPNLRPTPSTENTRVERFIRDKYERRMYFHAQYDAIVKMLLSDEGQGVSPDFMVSSREEQVADVSALQQKPQPPSSSPSSSLTMPMLWSNDFTSAGVVKSPAPAASVDAKNGIDLNDLFAAPKITPTWNSDHHSLELQHQEQKKHGQQQPETHTGWNKAESRTNTSQTPLQTGCSATPMDTKTEIMSLFNSAPPHPSTHVYSAWQPKQPSAGSYFSQQT